VAYDLALGQISRDWSCGEHDVSTPKPALETAADVNPIELAKTVQNEIARNTNLVIRLRKAKHLPEAEFASYRKFHTTWLDYYNFHKGRFRTQDNLNLWNLRELNKQFAGRFQILDNLAKTSIKRPTAPRTPLETTTEIVLPSRPGGSVASAVGHPWAVLLGAGLTIGTLAWLSGVRNVGRSGGDGKPTRKREAR
jgi:hypothetical protein